MRRTWLAPLEVVLSPLGITALLLAAFAAFTWLSARKLAIVAALQPEVRWDHPWARVRTVIANGLLQQRMIRREWKPGVMHTVIFLGFVSLLVRKVQLIVIGFDEEFALTGPLGDAFTVWKDLVEVGVLLAVGYAFYRRLLLKPARLEPNREGLLVLGLITIIMLTDFAFDAFRFAQLSGSVAGHRARAGACPDRRLARVAGLGLVARRRSRPLRPSRTGRR